LFTGICNSGSGTYTYSYETGEIEVTDLGSTKIYCQYIEWEEYTIQNLNKAYSYNLNGDQLIIFSHGPYNLNFTKGKLSTMQ
jgi:heat shock protein HslJ